MSKVENKMFKTSFCHFKGFYMLFKSRYARKSKKGHYIFTFGSRHLELQRLNVIPGNKTKINSKHYTFLVQTSKTWLNNSKEYHN